MHEQNGRAAPFPGRVLPKQALRHLLPAVIDPFPRPAYKPGMPTATLRNLGSKRRLGRTAPLLLAGLGIIALAARAADDPPATRPATGTVHLVIDYNDGVEKHYTRLAWRKGLTVLDVLQMAKEHARGIAFEHRGSGQTVFVTRIDDLTNEGARGKARNWTFKINDKLSDRGAGVCEVAATDTIRWIYSERNLK